MGIKLKTGATRNSSRVSAVLGGLICFTLGGFSVYIAAGGGELVGGIPLLPRVANEILGRIIAGTGGLFCFALGTYAFHEAWVLHRERVSAADAPGVKRPGDG